MESIVEIGKRHGSDKGTAHSYLEVYDHLFHALRGEPITLVEIGVDRGESLKLWWEVFPNAHIVGIDNVPRPGWKMPDDCVVIDGDATNQELIDREFVNDSIDVVIDDGSHKLNEQLLTWCWMAPKLKQGGMHVIEDITGASFPVLQALGFLILDRRLIKNQWDDVLAIKTR